MLTFCIPNHSNYYHFVGGYLLGAQRELEHSGVWENRECEIWYQGRYRELVQTLSRYPIREDFESMPSDAVKTKDFGGLGLSIEMFRKLEPIRERLLSRFCGIESNVDGRLRITFVQRSRTRQIRNLSTLVNLVADLGVDSEVIFLERLSPGEQVRTVWSSDVVVGAHGAGLMHVLYMRAGSCLVEMFPRGFCSARFGGIAQCYSVQHYGIESCTPSEIGKVYDPACLEYLEQNGWPDSQKAEKDVSKWPKLMRRQMARTLRDISTFEIDERAVFNIIREYFLKCELRRSRL